MVNHKDIINEDVNNGIEYLPLQSFYAALKKNGFSLTTLQIINANQVIIQYANRVKNESELCGYLSPIFAANADEQLLFKQIFNTQFKIEGFKRVTPNEPLERPIEKWIKKNWRKYLTAYAFFAGVVILVIILISRNNIKTVPVIDPAKIDVFIKNKNDPKSENHEIPFQLKTHEKLEVTTFVGSKDINISAILRSRITLIVKYNWGDSTDIAAKPSHTYNSPGNYNLTANVIIFHDKVIIKKINISQIVHVCSGDNFLFVAIPKNKGAFLIGQTIKITASVSGKIVPDKIKWEDEEGETWYGNEMHTSFSKAGKYRITCVAIYGSINSPCTLKKSVDIIVAGSRRINDSIAVASSYLVTERLVYAKKVDPVLYYLYGIMAAVFLILSIFFIVLWERYREKIADVKKLVLEKYTILTSSDAGKKAPRLLPFKNKNYLPVHESEINEAAKKMRKRVNDNITFLDIGKTVRRSIDSGGLFLPVNTARTRQSEYLILIDEKNINSQQVKLFEYLVEILKKENVLINKYYYNQEPNSCYNINEPSGISLEKLNQKYEKHILLIFGTAYELISQPDLLFNNEYLELINRWQYKAIITPLSFSDWGIKEKNILLPRLPVFPIDIEGLLLFAEQLNTEGELDIISRLKQNEGIFYKAEGIDFDDINELETYCDNAVWARVTEDNSSVNILFQWIAALAIYPKIRWEIILAVGKSIFNKYNKSDELNFTNLVRIVRINWMRQGVFPYPIRFELLKSLTKENEIIARETILILLKEIPSMDPTSNNNYEENEFQQVINEFSLYAYDPILYIQYKESKYLFEKLWKDDKISDLPQREYLKNENTTWTTLVNKEGNNNSVENVGIQDYFKSSDKEETILSKMYLGLGVISIVVFVTSVFGLIILKRWEYL